MTQSCWHRGGYLTSYTETDPVASAAGYLTAYTETDPVASAAGYLTAFTETDPLASAAGYITSASTAFSDLQSDVEDLQVEFNAGGRVTRAEAEISDNAAAITAVTDQLNSLEDCPFGYLRDLSETQFVLCYDPSSNPSAPDEMVQVGDFWIDRYEASVWASPDCTGTRYGAAVDDYDGAGFSDTGNWTAEVYACSVATVTPSRFLTWFQAQQSCALAGKDLCSNEEWQAAAAGTVDPGSNDGGAGGACNTAGSSTRSTGYAGTIPSDVNSCVSAWGAEDMVGNLWEWAGDWHAAGVVAQTVDGAITTPWPSTYDDDMTISFNGRSWSTGTGWVNGLPSAVLRGGSSAEGTGSGVYATSMYNAPSDSFSRIGFRCCRRR